MEPVGGPGYCASPLSAPVETPDAPKTGPRSSAPQRPAAIASQPSRAERIRLWLARRADHPSALPMMMLLSFADACVSPILPEVLLVPMCLGRPERRWHYAFWSSIASVLGGILGFYLGMTLWEAGLREFFFDHVPGFTPETFAEVSQGFGRSTFLITFLAGFTPLPYKLFTVAAGVCHDQVDFTAFVFASLTSRTLRFYLEIWVLAKYGPPMLDFLVRRVGWVLVLLSIAALAAVLWLQA